MMCFIYFISSPVAVYIQQGSLREGQNFSVTIFLPILFIVLMRFHMAPYHLDLMSVQSYIAGGLELFQVVVICEMS